MLESSVERLLRELQDHQLVLDVGGWACPFNRAQWILDSEPYETRGFYRTFGGPASQGGDSEWFDRSRWIRRDICDREPWPFEDKQFDFAICSHTLEDVRDPLWVCAELSRVAKAGYIETPSRLFESCRGAESPRLAGLSHHRWFVEYEGSSVRFLMKYHFVHEGLPWSLPPGVLKGIQAQDRVGFLWWSDSFDSREVMIHGQDDQRRELERFVIESGRVPAWRLDLVRRRHRLVGIVRRVLDAARRRVRA